MEHGWISAINEASKWKHFTQVVPFDKNSRPIALRRNPRNNSQSVEKCQKNVRKKSQKNVNFYSRGRIDYYSNINSSKVEKTSHQKPEKLMGANLNHENNRIPGSIEEHIS